MHPIAGQNLQQSRFLLFQSGLQRFRESLRLIETECQTALIVFPNMDAIGFQAIELLGGDYQSTPSSRMTIGAAFDLKRCAILRMLGVCYKSCNARSRPNSWLNRLTACMASKELPPRTKKLSCMLIWLSGIPRTSDQIWESCLSTGFAGAT